MTHVVALSEPALDDLDALHIWVTEMAGESAADDYLERVMARIATLAQFPFRGSPRDELAQGLRTLSFERRLVIAYRIAGNDVQVQRVVSAQREFAGLFTS